jgi:hypothetical protein
MICNVLAFLLSFAIPKMCFQLYVFKLFLTSGGPAQSLKTDHYKSKFINPNL